MSAEAVRTHVPSVVGLDDLAAMIAADPYGFRYETSPEGVLSIMPPPDSEHAVIATRLMVWLAMAGWPLDQLMQVAGIRIPGSRVDGGRIPDLTVWTAPQPTSVWLALTDLLLAIEIVSPGSALTDEDVKRDEYAAAGIPHYWVVGRDAAQTVTLYRIGPDKAYEVSARTPLAWLLQAAPSDHLG